MKASRYLTSLAACILPAAATGCGGQQALTAADVIRNADHYPKEENPTYAPIFIDGYKLMLVQEGDRMPRFHPHGICGSGLRLKFS
jgi:hypothetical protein